MSIVNVAREIGAIASAQVDAKAALIRELSEGIDELNRTLGPALAADRHLREAVLGKPTDLVRHQWSIPFADLFAASIESRNVDVSDKAKLLAAFAETAKNGKYIYDTNYRLTGLQIERHWDERRIVDPQVSLRVVVDSLTRQVTLHIPNENLSVLDRVVDQNQGTLDPVALRGAIDALFGEMRERVVARKQQLRTG